MGPLNQVLGMIPGINAKCLIVHRLMEKKMLHTEAIIQSLTKQERSDPSIVNGNRRKRIATGSGTSIQDVNRLLKDFEEMKKLLDGS